MGLYGPYWASWRDFDADMPPDVPLTAHTGLPKYESHTSGLG